MLIDSEFEVAAPVDTVWKYLLDVPRMAPNLPGAELTEVVDENNYKGRVTTKMGPVSLRFGGTVEIVERDEAKHTVVINAAGADERGRGQATMVVTATLLPAGRGTKATVGQDLQIAGAAAQFGRGMIADVTNVLMQTFAANIAEDIPRWTRGEERAATSSAPAQGFAIGLQATINGLKRFVRRLFGVRSRPLPSERIAAL
ncbi:MAG TPA: SRPBCC family protein [Pseudonocardiaceae bacterium]|jgi:carbon monoxide dehydrogenase subunit G|nr:SRPBCC family protein [Pseudonocardiaceae bacterium]